MTYDAETDTVVAEAYQPSTDYSSRQAKHADPEWANKVDRDEFIDKISVHLLAGDGDLYGNVDIGEDGTVHLYDYDRATRIFSTQTPYDDLLTGANKAETIADRLDKVRDDDNQMDISRVEVADRVAEIAYEIETSGHKETVYEAVESQMEAMASTPATAAEDCKKHHDFVENIETLAEVARDHFGWD
jgi:hypothetical protein